MNWHRIGLSVVPVFWIGACTTEPQPATPLSAPPTVASIPQPPASASSSVSAPASASTDAKAESVTRIQPLANPGCTLSLGSGDLAKSLALVVPEHRLVDVRGPVSSLDIQISPTADRATVQLSTPALRLEAEVDTSYLRFAHGAAAKPLLGWIEFRSAPMTRCAGGMATLPVNLPSLIAAAVQPVQVPVSDLTLFRSPTAYEGSVDILKPGATGDLKLTPNGQVFAKLQPSRPGGRLLPGDEVQTVRVLAKEKGLVRIRFFGNEVSVVGWIDAKVLDSQQAIGLLSALSGAPPRPLNPGKVRCSSDVPLHTRIANKEIDVGILRAGASVPARATASGLLQVLLENLYNDSELDALEGASRSSVAEVFIPRVQSSACTLSAADAGHP